MKLLNPGPVTLTKGVRQALLGDDLCHREPEFAELSQRIISGLANVYEDANAQYVPVLLTSSGTGAVEAMFSLVPGAGSNTLVAANGVYGDRAAAMLTAQGKRHHVVSSPWTSPIDFAAIETALQAGNFDHVFAVHHETTTGRLNDIDKLGALCTRYKVPLLLDAVSSFAGERIQFAEWNLLACAATANKCLHGVPGIAMVLVHKPAFTDRKSGATSVYLDLFRYRKEQTNGFSPFTQSVQVLYALDRALIELSAQGGWRARHQRYSTLTNRVRSALAEMGIRAFLDDEASYGVTLSSYRLPSGLAYERLHDELKREGFIIYAGQGPFAGQMFRVAVMGELSDADIDQMLSIVRRLA